MTHCFFFTHFNASSGEKTNIPNTAIDGKTQITHSPGHLLILNMMHPFATWGKTREWWRQQEYLHAPATDHVDGLLN